MRRKQTKKGRKKSRKKMKGGMSETDFRVFKLAVYDRMKSEKFSDTFLHINDNNVNEGFQISLKHINDEKRTEKDIGKYHIHVLREYQNPTTGKKLCDGTTSLKEKSEGGEANIGWHLKTHYGNKHSNIPLKFTGKDGVEKSYGENNSQFYCFNDDDIKKAIIDYNNGTNTGIDKIISTWKVILEKKIPSDLPPAIPPFKSRSNMSSEFLSSALSMPSSRRRRSPGRRGRSPNRSHSHFRSRSHRSRSRSPSRRSRSGRYGGKKKTKKKCGGENSSIRSKFRPKSRSRSRYNPNCVKRQWTGKQCLCKPEKPEDGDTPVSLKEICEGKK